MPHAPPTTISAGSNCLRLFLDSPLVLFLSCFPFDAFTSAYPGIGIAPISSFDRPVHINHRVSGKIPDQQRDTAD
jgi:hypothetical protein